jgi:RNA polymerase sigma-70 factor, ECF subfamily
MVAFRLDQRLQGRVDPSDVLQDAYVEAWQDLGIYMKQPVMPFFLWLREIAGNKLRELHRHHLGTPMLDPRREVSIYGGPWTAKPSGKPASQYPDRNIL